MKHSGNNRPPRLVLAFFRRFCRPEFREDIEGDLLERFHQSITKFGASKARWLFIKDVLLLFRPGIIRDLKNLPQYKLFTMKRFNWVKMTGINLLVIMMIILPFLPGPPNKLVIGLSILGQSAGFFGLLLVPIGIAWTIMEIRKWKKINNENPDWRASYYLSISAMVIIVAIYLLLVTGAFVNLGVVAGLLGLIPGAFGSYWAIKGIKKLRFNSDRKLNPMPLYLLTIPLIAFLTNMYLVEPISDYSRNFAIQRCQILIASIEDYKNKEGKYPESIQNLETRYRKKIPSPFIMGILNFRYNKINDQYSLSFSQWLDLGSLEEIVLYDRNDIRNNLKGEFAKYDYKFDLCRVKGAFASYDTRHDHWRYYRLD